MTLMNGYELQTTFIQDFAIAEMFGVSAVRDTYERSFNEWKNDYVYLTELVIALNLRLWATYEMGNMAMAKLYDELWRTANDYAWENLTGEELTFFYTVTD